MAGKDGDKDPFAIPVFGHGIGRRVIVSSVLAGLLIVGVGGWAAQAKLSGAVVTQGQIAVTDQVKTIQHIDGGVISAILVKNGDSVKKGDVLIRLDETQIKVERAIITGQLDQLQAMKARLEAERDGKASVSFPVSLSPEVTTAERKLFDENRAMLENQRTQLGLQVEQLRNQTDGLAQQKSANIAEKEILLTEIATASKLVDTGLGRTSDLRGLKRQLVRLDGAIGDMTARMAEAEGQVSELNIKLMSLDQTRRSEAQKEIVATDSRIAELREREIAATHRLSRTEIRAPENGVVYDLQVHTIGGVIGSGAILLSLVPENATLAVEIRVPPADVDRVFPGQDTRMRLTAFNARTTPEITGKLDVISAATTQDRMTGQSFYPATVKLNDAEIAALSKDGKKLVPGMPVEVFVQTEERTAMSYLTKPFTDQVMKAFREE